VRLEKTAQRGASLSVLLARYYPRDQIEEGGIGGKCGTHGQKKIAYKILAGKTEGRRLKRRWDSRFNLDLKDMG